MMTVAEATIIADHYRRRAEEVRTIAENMNDHHGQSVLLAVAATWDDMADQITRIADNNVLSLRHSTIAGVKAS